MILVIGAGGLVGQSFVNFYPQKSDLVCPTSFELDINNTQKIDEFLKDSKISHILLLAAYTDVENAQKDPTLAKKINIDGSKNVADACKKYNKHLIYVSTDFVFSGSEDQKGPYSDTAKTASPDSDKIGEYARSKLMGEISVKESGCKYSIIRIGYPFGNSENEKDFARKTLKLIQNGYALFSDQQFSPTYIPDISKAVYKIINEDLAGTFHLACTPITTPLEFGKYLSKKVGLDKEIKSGSLKDFMVGRTPKSLFGGLIPSRGFEVSSWKDAIDSISGELKKFV